MTELKNHPAKYSQSILEYLGAMVREEQFRRGYPMKVFDPFAGTGLIHEFAIEGKIKTCGYEIEPEWALYHPETHVGNSLETHYETGTFDIICTSPVYGNRMADHHEAKDDSKRMTYRHQLGRPLSEGSSAGLAWGPRYWEFHELAWQEATRILKPGGLFLLNVKDFYRTRTVRRTKVTERVEVCQWHVDYLISLGYVVEAEIPVPVRGMRMGQNHKKRMGHEMIYALRRKW